MLQDEARYIHELGQRLQVAFVEVATRTGVTLVDAYTASIDHGTCATSGPRWVAGLNPTDSAPFHPTAAGHLAMADLVLAALRR